MWRYKNLNEHVHLEYGEYPLSMSGPMIYIDGLPFNESLNLGSGLSKCTEPFFALIFTIL